MSAAVLSPVGEACRSGALMSRSAHFLHVDLETAMQLKVGVNQKASALAHHKHKLKFQMNIKPLAAWRWRVNRRQAD